MVKYEPGLVCAVVQISRPAANKKG